MADYWKSQPRKFCQYCKCWIADNKPSIEFHERGKNHKENVAAKISEIKKKSIDKVKQEERMSKEFAAMEEAAMKAYQEDLKRMGAQSGFQAPTAAPAEPQTQAQIQAHPPTGARKQIGPDLGPFAASQAQRQSESQQKGKRKQKKEHGKHPYKRRGPPAVQTKEWVEGMSEDGHKYFYNTRTGESKWENPEDFQEGSSGSAQLGQDEKPSGSTWMEAVSTDGYTYYYNSETGESSWERPADFPANDVAESASEGSKEGESQEEASNPQPEPLPAMEETSNPATASQQEAQEVGQDGQESDVPQISLRERNDEAEPSANEGEDKVSSNIPKEDTVEKNRDLSLRPEPEKEKVVVPMIRFKKSKTANPYGAWEQIKEEVDPYLKVDLQLPKVEEVCTSGPPEPPPEPKPKFRERIITSLGTEGGPASFRKSKMANGKSRSIRRRDDDD